MIKYFLYSTLILSVLVLSGCSLGGGSSSGNVGGIMMSTDSGISWESKNRVDEERSISGVEVLSILADSADSETVFLGTKSRGILISEDNADSWAKFPSPSDENVYGIAMDYFNSQVMYASGTLNGRGKIFKTQDRGENWEEIYTEPADGTYVTAMSMNNNDPNNVFVGTSRGVILRTNDGGASWDNLYSAEGPISKIIFDESNGKNVFFLVYKKDILVSDINGNEFKKVSSDNKIIGRTPIYSFDLDRSKSGTIYIGTDEGLFKSADYGKNFEEIDIIASSKDFPIRAVAVNPFNSNEIIYSAAQAIYRSNDGGIEWSTSQLNTSKFVSDIKFNRGDTSIVWTGFRSFK